MCRQSRQPELQVEHVVSKFLDYCTANRKPCTAQIYTHFLWKWMLKVGLTKPVKDLVPLDLESNAKTWHQIQSVQRCFQWAVETAGLIERNVFARVKRPRVKGRRLTLSPGELTRLLWRAKVKPADKPEERGRPSKPHKDFPLYPSLNGLWAKKIRCKLRYFGSWASDRSGERALLLWLAEKDDLLAGRRPVARQAVAGRHFRGLQAPPNPLYFRHFLMAMRETLARPQEIRSLCWNMLQPEDPREKVEEALPAGRAVFVLEDYKARDRRADSSEPRVILINNRLGRLLLRLRSRAQTLDDYVFVNSKGKPWSGNAVRCRMRRLRTDVKPEKPSKQENVVAYTIRHSTATIATAAGVVDQRLAALLGHTDPRTTRRYQHLQIKHLREAMKQIDAAR